MGDSDLTKLTQAPGRPAGDIKAVPVRRPGRWLAAFVVLVIAASIVRSIVTNKRFDWSIVWHYLFDPRILHGVIATLYLTALSMVIGVLLGILMAVMRLSPNPIVSGASWLYIYFFRGTPLLVQIIFWYNIAALFPVIDLGIPFGPAFVHPNSNTVITLFVAALLALGLNEGAYMAEIVRAGIISVREGQSEAAASLGMSRLQIMRHIVLPQAMRVILPPTGNEMISMLKNTSLASTIAFAECSMSPVDLRGQLPDDSAADRREHLVPGADQHRLRRPVLPGTEVRRGLLAHRAGDDEGTLVGARPGRKISMTDEVVSADGVHKRFGRNEVLKGIDLTVNAARSCACWARPARASRRSCAASTTSRRSTPGACRSTASSSATARPTASCTSCTSARSRASASRSGWSSSSSTCSRI